MPTGNPSENIPPCDYDAIIVGAGIIGCCTAFELAKKGYRTLNVDKLASAGAGSTANSCAVIRVHYSTLDGTALAYESYHYWDAWQDYLGILDPRGTAEFYQRGILVFKSGPNDGLKSVCGHLEALGIPYELSLIHI